MCSQCCGRWSSLSGEIAGEVIEEGWGGQNPNNSGSKTPHTLNHQVEINQPWWKRAFEIQLKQVTCNQRWQIIRVQETFKTRACHQLNVEYITNAWKVSKICPQEILIRRKLWLWGILRFIGGELTRRREHAWPDLRPNSHPRTQWRRVSVK